jgi:hypothetical protein
MSRPSPHVRWQAWQATPRPQRCLSEDERREGYTVVRIPPHGREAFLDLLKLLSLVQTLASRREPDATFQDLWSAWQTSQRQLTGVFLRLRDHQPASHPLVEGSHAR